MKILLISIGKVKGLFADPIAEYEKRIRRYYTFEPIEVREHPSHQSPNAAEVMEVEGKRILERVPTGFELIALDRSGKGWTSEQLSGYISQLGVQAMPGAAFVIGGAFGLSDEVLRRSKRQLSLSAFTLPHEMARLVLTEQIYRAGTIARGEPYHKGEIG